ncbi:MAG TPA: branched-chain amino acid ABC transporter permease [Chloroflexia bacterium]|nr:branched-chain amino acid ABC transporter permease [Chloroflexia bacterium]
MQQSTTSGRSFADKSLFPPARRASRRSQIVAFILGTLLLLLPVPELLAANGILVLPGRQFYNQAFMNAAADTGAFVLLALGLNIVVGYAGLLDLGYAAFFAIGTYTYAILASSFFDIHTPFWVMLFVSGAVTALFGLIFGAPTLRLRGDYLAIVTLGFGEIVPTFILNLDKMTGGADGIGGIDRPVIGSFIIGANNDNIAFYYLTLVLAVLMIFVINRLRDSRLGRAWMAIREDELAAASMGINTTSTKLLAFALGAGISGFAGTFYGSHLGFASPDQFHFSQSVLILCMVILGGMGNMWGVILGAIIIYLLQTVLLIQLNTWLNDLGRAINFQALAEFNLSTNTFFIYGIILVLFMLFRPEGLLPSGRRRAELHPETADISQAERQEVYDTREAAQADPDTKGGG